MIVIEFVIFVISSGVFCHANFRHRLWAVIIAGAVATGSSLLFFWDLYEKLEAPAQAPVKIVKQMVPVVQHISQPPQLSKPQDCRSDFPFWSRIFGDEGTTELAFQVMTDGTVSGIKVTRSSGSDRLDDAAVKCVGKWHYRPAIRDGQLVNTPLTVKVNWNLDSGDNGDAGKKGDSADDSNTEDGP